jgi:hypothetical protein
MNNVCDTISAAGMMAVAVFAPVDAITILLVALLSVNLVLTIALNIRRLLK